VIAALLANLQTAPDQGTGDPLFANGINWEVIVIVIVKVLVAFVVLLVATALMIWFERKVISDMQSRIGPNRAGPWGLLQTLADGTKLIFKEDLLPERADSFVFKLAPYLSVVPAVLIFAVVPVGGIIRLGSHTFELQVSDPPMGILFVLAMSGIAVYGVMLAGWSSGSKYPLLGSVRASAQVISYEAALGMTTVMVVLVSHSLSTRAIVAAQSNGFWNWNIIRLGFLPFIFFMIAITAELTRPPFDLTEAEQELVGGFHTEYSSIRFGLFFLAEFMNTITMSAVVVTLFFGGPNGWIPRFIPTSDIWMPIIWFLLKTVAFCFIYVWFRAALPRLRYDQLMDLGWKRLIPMTLAWLLLVAAVVTWHWGGLFMIPVVLVAAVLLTRANKLGAGRSAQESVLPAVGQRLTPAPRLTGIGAPGLGGSGPASGPGPDAPTPTPTGGPKGSDA
jgi:NADH-quinone oxidoreductase subunit H